MSKNIISRKLKLVWDHFKKSFFGQISENIKISKKRVIFLNFFKNSCLLISPKISKFKQQVIFFRSLHKNSFFPYVQKYQQFEERMFFEITLRKSFIAHISENVKIKGKWTVFVGPYLRKYFFLDYFKDSFLLISTKISEMELFFRSLLKNSFFFHISYFIKISAFRGKNVF